MLWYAAKKSTEYKSQNANFVTSSSSSPPPPPRSH
jgi:hypothetical protein